jgi:serine/threonine-protein kinase
MFDVPPTILAPESQSVMASTNSPNPSTDETVLVSPFNEEPSQHQSTFQNQKTFQTQQTFHSQPPTPNQQTSQNQPHSRPQQTFQGQQTSQNQPHSRPQQTFQGQQTSQNKPTSRTQQTFQGQKTSQNQQITSLNAAFVQRCQEALAFYIGPIASLVIEDALAENPQATPYQFVELLAREIPEPQAALEFTRRLFS